ncbi:hypothetical protein BHM03_00056748 [Ensete ventricosum]|nr:hypothetical protein BHM03_00056748 [Ensete ventricosum]
MILGTSLLGDVTLKEESPFSPARVKVEDLGEGSANRSPSNLAAGASKMASNVGQLKDNSDGPKVEDSYADRTIGVKKPKCSGDEGPSITESGYNPKRREFDPEYDKDAEQSLADMEFKENDSETERELKLRMLRIYLSSFNCQECRAAGCRTLAEAKAYTEQKRKRELEASTQNSKENTQVHSGSKLVQKANQPLNKEKGENDGSPRNTIDNHKIKGGTGLDSGGKDSLSTATGQVSVRSFDEWDITGLPGTELLSETITASFSCYQEQEFCCQNRLLPSHYLKMQETLVQEIYKGNIANKSDGVYDMVKKKLGQQEEPTVV